MASAVEIKGFMELDASTSDTTFWTSKPLSSTPGMLPIITG